MRIRVSAPGNELKQEEIDRIEHDLEKIDRRLQDFREEVQVDVRISNAQRPGAGDARHVLIELDYGRTHLKAKAESADVGQAVREAREDLLRQINDRKPGGHSARAKGL
ncbi:MAG TPA: HPF/RaiA family ribosome-associated protein [Actinomycetota bacterium]|nr:HPF/RaiA family ribosome-associated protein [Actinomycetota bacterium]